MIRSLCFAWVLFGWALLPAALPAQSAQDSLQSALQLIGQLVQAENYEAAQLEAELLRDLLRRNEFAYPPAAVSLLSKIYLHNRDTPSAMGFLADATASSRKDSLPGRRIDLLQALVAAFTDWEAYPQALACQRAMLVLKDTEAQRQRQGVVENLQARIDSMTRAASVVSAEQERGVRLKRTSLLGFAALLALLFGGLFLLHFRLAGRWRKREGKFLRELDFLRSERYQSTLPAEPALASPADAAVHQPFEPVNKPGQYRPDKVALIIEPNRQIVLYLKSLLADRFEVETAGTPTEGLQVASNHLPDLIVCDAVLNGQTGIDVVRQIKLSEKTNHIPVILLSAHHGNEGKLDALRAGADAWFNRPVLDVEFDTQVTRLLDARKENHAHFTRFLHLYFSENRIALADPFLHRMVTIID
ncbi:MAG: response regulator, partial [Saprospiraceae bacterium]|nr:response regulator [Saprospiraceae bacterium]